MGSTEDNLIDKITDNRQAHYEPYGWHHWPEHPWLAYQFRRGLGETQEGGGSGERVLPGREPDDPRRQGELAPRVAAHRRAQLAPRRSRGEAGPHPHGDELLAPRRRLLPTGGVLSQPDDPRRLADLHQDGASSTDFLSHLDPPGEVLEIPYENGVTLYAYFVRAPCPCEQPCLISMGGLDSIKDEMWFMQAHGALQRGISVLMIDVPGQGGTLRRHKLVNRVGLRSARSAAASTGSSTRTDVDVSRIAVCGSSLGGYYSARAACYEHRLAACISHGAIWAITDLWGNAAEDHGLAEHIKWVFGKPSMKESMVKARDFTLEGHLERMKCPYLVMHGGHDVLTVSQAQKVYEYGKAKGLDVTLRLLSEEETGAEHCQHDNPTVGQEVLADWLADRFGIDQSVLLTTSHTWFWSCVRNVPLSLLEALLTRRLRSFNA